MRDELGMHRMNISLNRSETAAEQKLAIDNMMQYWWKERVTNKDVRESPFTGTSLDWAVRHRLIQSGAQQVKYRRTHHTGGVYSQTLVDLCKMLGDGDANSIWTQEIDSQFLSTIQTAAATYNRGHQDETAHTMLAQNQEADRVMSMAGRFLLQTAEWVGTPRWTPGMNDMFSSLEQLYAEVLKSLKAQGNEKNCLLYTSDAADE